LKRRQNNGLNNFYWYFDRRTNTFFSLIGYGIELILRLFHVVSWDYWQRVAVGLVSLILLSGIINIIPKISIKLGGKNR
jgi:hypothetical protein